MIRSRGPAWNEHMNKVNAFLRCVAGVGLMVSSSACSQTQQGHSQSQPTSRSAVDRMSEEDARSLEQQESDSPSSSGAPVQRTAPRRTERDQPAAGIRR